MSATFFTTPLSSVGTSLGANYTAGSGHMTVAINTGILFGNASPTAPVWFAVANRSYFTNGQLSDPTKTAVYSCTGKTGDVLNGVSVQLGTTDQNFSTSDYVTLLATDLSVIGDGPRLVIDVRTFGAVGDGVTDDTVALQTALDVAQLIGGARVVCAPGRTYLVSFTGTKPSNYGVGDTVYVGYSLLLRSKVHLDLNGSTIFLKTGSNCAVFLNENASSITPGVPYATDIGLSNGSINGNRSGQIYTPSNQGGSMFCVDIRHAQRVTIRDLHLTEVRDTGVYAQDVDDMDMDNVSVDGSDGDCVTLGTLHCSAPILAPASASSSPVTFLVPSALLNRPSTDPQKLAIGPAWITNTQTNTSEQINITAIDTAKSTVTVSALVNSYPIYSYLNGAGNGFDGAVRNSTFGAIRASNLKGTYPVSVAAYTWSSNSAGDLTIIVPTNLTSTFTPNSQFTMGWPGRTPSEVVTVSSSTYSSPNTTVTLTSSLANSYAASTPLISFGSIRQGNPFFASLRNCSVANLEAFNCSGGYKIQPASENVSIANATFRGGSYGTDNCGFKIQGAPDDPSLYPRNIALGQVVSQNCTGQGLFLEGLNDCSVDSYLGFNCATAGDRPDIWLGKGTRLRVGHVSSSYAGLNGVQIKPYNDDVTIESINVYQPGQVNPKSTVAINDVSVTSNTATITTSANHNFPVGSTVVINGLTNSFLNGTWTIVSVPTATTFTFAITHANLSTTFDNGRATCPSPVSVVSASVNNVAVASNVATITTSAAHNFPVGATVVITGLMNSFLTGTWTIAAVPSTTTFTFAVLHADLTSISDSGTASSPIAASVISSIAVSSNVATITTTSPHNFPLGAFVQITGLTNSFLNSTWAITSVPSTTTFTFAITHGNVSTTSDNGLAALTSGTTAIDLEGFRGRIGHIITRGDGINMSFGLAVNTPTANFEIGSLDVSGQTNVPVWWKSSSLTKPSQVTISRLMVDDTHPTAGDVTLTAGSTTTVFQTATTATNLSHNVFQYIPPQYSPDTVYPILELTPKTSSAQAISPVRASFFSYNLTNFDQHGFTLHHGVADGTEVFAWKVLGWVMTPVAP